MRYRRATHAQAHPAEASPPSERSGSGPAQLVVSAEAAHVTSRRHIGLVHMPDAIKEPAADMAAGALKLGTRALNS
jgi:hypothetical protein